MFWNDPNLYGATFPIKDVQPPFGTLPWQNIPRFDIPRFVPQAFNYPFYQNLPQTLPFTQPFMQPFVQPLMQGYMHPFMQNLPYNYNVNLPPFNFYRPYTW
jgi:hypothetical protein